MFKGTRKAIYTRALDINNRGQIVGDYGTRPSARKPELLRVGGRMSLHSAVFDQARTRENRGSLFSSLAFLNYVCRGGLFLGEGHC